VRTKDPCWSVGTIYDHRELLAVSTVGTRLDGCYQFTGPILALLGMEFARTYPHDVLQGYNGQRKVCGARGGFSVRRVGVRFKGAGKHDDVRWSLEGGRHMKYEYGLILKKCKFFSEKY
jgi:hypothetical protein